MKNINDLKELNTPIVKIDKTLNKFKGTVLFPEKLAQANEMLKRIGLPKEWVK